MTTIRYKMTPTWHQTGLTDSASGRPYCVAETPANLLIRLKGTRQVLKLPWTLVYLKAAWVEAARLKLEKINARKAKKKGRAV